MNLLKLELKKRNREYGIITWESVQDFEIKTFLRNSNKVNVQFGKKVYSNRKVDYKYKRIAFGKKRMTNINNKYVLLSMKDGNLVVN